MRAAFIPRERLARGVRRDRVGNSGYAHLSRAERRGGSRPRRLPALLILLNMTREQAQELAD